MQARFTLDLPQGCAKRRLWQWHRNQTLVYLCTALCTHAKVAQHSISGNVPQWEEKELLIARLTRRTVSAVQLVAPEQRQSIRSLAWALPTALPTAQIIGPWRGAGYSHTGPWHQELLLKPCSISHCFCGGQKADLGLDKSASTNKELWPVPSFCSLTFCRLQNSRLLVSLNNFHTISFFPT